MTTNHAYAKRLITALLDLNITQSELAKKSGVSRYSISGFVRGLNIPSAATQAKIEAAIEALSNPPPPEPPLGENVVRLKPKN